MRHLTICAIALSSLLVVASCKDDGEKAVCYDDPAIAAEEIWERVGCPNFDAEVDPADYMYPRLARMDATDEENGGEGDFITSVEQNTCQPIDAHAFLHEVDFVLDWKYLIPNCIEHPEAQPGPQGPEGKPGQPGESGKDAPPLMPFCVQTTLVRFEAPVYVEVKKGCMCAKVARGMSGTYACTPKPEYMTRAFVSEYYGR